MSMYPADCKYTKDHEWIKVEGGVGRVGITDFAQKQLGDVVFLDLPQVGRALKQGDAFGTVESVKAVSELYSPVSGEVVAVNTALAEKPETVNKDPHGSWMVEIRLSAPAEMSSLLAVADYSALVK
ncbi:MAG: glycine cleavage system protein GcvH [Acidobacteria bacterium]|nr:glycine cleavage system protein GcvH [Acidobacteriota bacterium]